MPSPNDGVYIPVTLDLSETKKQLEELKATVEQTEMRPNSVLQDFFAGVAGETERAAKAVSQMRTQMAAMAMSGGLRAHSVGMNMSAMAAYSAAPKFNPFIGMQTSSTGTMFNAAKMIADMRAQMASMATPGGLRSHSVGMNMGALSSYSAAPKFNPFAGMRTSASGTMYNAAEALANMQAQVAAMATPGGLRSHSVGMNMAALASSSADQKFNPYIGMKTSASGTMYRAVPELDRGPFYSERYKTIEQRGDEASQRRYEAGFQNRYMNRELSNGDMEKRIAATLKAEAAAKKLEKQNEKLIAQTRLMERQQKYGKYGGALAHMYAENQGVIGRVAGGFGQIAGGAATMAGYGLAGLAASGYSGTVEGERFGRELRGLSLQLASVMKPLMDSLTNVTRNARQKLAGMSEDEQNQLMKSGTALGGGFLGARIGSVFGPYGTMAGGLLGAGLGYAAPDLMSPENYRRRDILAGSASRQMIGQNENLRGMSLAERQKRIEDTTQLSVERLKVTAQAVKNAPDEATRKELAKRYLEEAFSYRENLNAMNKINDEENSPVGAALAGMRRAGIKPSGPNRRDVMITDGVGFAETGSTFTALQEELIRTDAAESPNKAVVDKLEEIRQLVEKQNRPG